jgi:hypothetical protein
MADDADAVALLTSTAGFSPDAAQHRAPAVVPRAPRRLHVVGVVQPSPRPDGWSLQHRSRSRGRVLSSPTLSPWPLSQPGRGSSPMAASSSRRGGADTQRYMSTSEVRCVVLCPRRLHRC